MRSLAAARTGWSRLPLAYVELTKPRIVMLVIMTGVPAMLIAARGFPAPTVFWGALLGTALAAASAASFNHYYDRDIDALMVRTAARPLPAGILPPPQALVFGFVLAALSLLVLLATTNVLAAAIAMFSIFYYAVVYTIWLKRSTPQNIVIGGAAGASAPLIAWAAVTGHIGLAAVLQALIVFLWTPPHFWALALYRSDDYEAAGIPMLPVTHGHVETRRRILLYSLVLVGVTLGLGMIGAAGWVYDISASLLGLGFLYYAFQLYRTGAEMFAVKLFRYSILYLFMLFVMMTVDAALRAGAGLHLFGRL